MPVPTPLSTLAVVNQMLGMLGERGLNSLEEPHPMLPDALAALNNASATTQSQLWWFNTEYLTLQPQATTGFMLVPNDTASCDSLTQYPRLSVRGDRLYNLDEQSDTFERPLRVRLHRIVPFDGCPVSARNYISCLARVEFCTNFDGDQLKIRLAQEAAGQAYVTMHAEHIRNANTNMMYRPSMQAKLASIVGGRRPWPTGGNHSLHILGGG